MELYILSKEDLSILSVCKLADYEINLDEETNAKSTFTLMKVNGLKKGNFMVLNGLYKQFLFIIDEINTEKGSGVATVTALDISNIFDRKVIEKNINTMKNKSIEEFIANTISENFVNSDDIALNVGYIDTYWHTNTKSSVDTNAENGLYNFHTFLTNCRQYKNIYSDFKVENIGKPQALKGKELTVQARNRKVLDISLHGETSQATRSGKNKLPYNYYDSNSKTINGITFTVNKDRSITANGTATANAQFSITNPDNYAIVAGSYKLVGENNAYTKKAIRGSYKKADGTIRYISSDSSFTIPEGATNVHIYVVILQGETVNNVTFYPMLLNLTETDLTFEAGGASPSPDYPAKIENVEGKNKFNNNFSDYTKPTDYYICPIHVKNETSYKFNINLIGTKMTGCVIGIVKDGNQYSNFVGLSQALNSVGSVNNLSFKVDNTWVSPKLVIYAPKGETQFKQIFENYEVQLEEGTTATPYAPYNSLEVKNIGINLLKNSSLTENLEDWDVVRTDNTTLSISEIFNKKCLHIKGGLNKGQYIRQPIQNRIQVGNKYTISCKAYLKDFVSGTTNPICAFYLDGVGIDGKWIGPAYSGGQNFSDTKYNYSQGFIEVKTTITINKNTDLTKTFAMFVYARDFTGDLYIYDLQLEEGTTATPYKPYQEQKIDFPLSENQKLMEGSYLASDGIHYKRKQVVLDGSKYENWAIWTASLTNVERFYINLEKPAKYNGVSLCSHFRLSSADSDTEHFRWSTSSGIQKQFVIFIDKSKATTVAELKTWLQSNPITVEYELTEEEIVPYTEAQQEAWDKLQNLMLYEGINHISSNANMVLSYYPLNPIGIKLILRIDIENKVEETKLIDTTLPEVTDYNKIYEEDVTAKVQVYIREDGSEYNLYLKTDRTTTTNKDDPNRLSGKIEVISVDTADKAAEEALNVMKGNRYKHLVEFKIAKTSKLMDITQLYIRKTS